MKVFLLSLLFIGNVFGQEVFKTHSQELTIIDTVECSNGECVNKSVIKVKNLLGVNYDELEVNSCYVSKKSLSPIFVLSKAKNERVELLSIKTEHSRLFIIDKVLATKQEIDSGNLHKVPCSILDFWSVKNEILSCSKLFKRSCYVDR